VNEYPKVLVEYESYEKKGNLSGWMIEKNKHPFSTLSGRTQKISKSSPFSENLDLEKFHDPILPPLYLSLDVC
jgi:hypothetical protein